MSVKRPPAPDDWKDRVGFYGSLACLLAVDITTDSLVVRILATAAYFGIYQTIWRRLRISAGYTSDALKIGRALLAKESGDPKPILDLIEDLRKVDRVVIRESS